MIRKKIGVVSNSNVAYKNFLALNEITDINTDSVLGLDLLVDMFIVDITEFEKGVQCIANIRSLQKQFNKPILWVVDPLDSHEALLALEELTGLGRVKIQYRNTIDPQGIMQSVALLLYPDLPTKRVSMDLFIPIFNEAHRIKYVREFAEKLRQLHTLGYPYITIYFIDDGSNDASEDFLVDMIETYQSICDSVDYKSAFHIVKLNDNTRKAGTYMEAFKLATADIIVFADADNAFQIEDISKLINIIEQGFYDIVIGTKDKTAEDRPLIRDIVSTFKRILTKPLLPDGVTDSQTGLKLFRGQVVKHILPTLDHKYGLAIDLKIIYEAKKLQLRVLEVPVFFKDREGSHIDVVFDSFRFIKNMVKISIGL